ncbi:TPA: hypothetical protein ACLAQP_002042, partial [Neisseria meningitidis]
FLAHFYASNFVNRLFLQRSHYMCKPSRNAKYRLKIFQTVFAVFIAVFLPYPDFCLGLKQIGSQIAIKE